MTLVETQHRLALEQLRRAGEQPVSLAALRAAGLDAPAAVISELELSGHVIERVYEHGRLVGLRLIEPEDASPDSRSRRRKGSLPERSETASIAARAGSIRYGPLRRGKE